MKIQWASGDETYEPIKNIQKDVPTIAENYENSIK